MLVGGVRQVQFETASVTADWVFPYLLIVPGINGWAPEQDEVVLGMSPDAVRWDDYGVHSRNFPITDRAMNQPWFQASSDDDSGVVILVDPNRIEIVVPYNIVRSFGLGSIAVGVQYRNKLLGRRTTLLTGRLPLTDGVV